jgi:hypothetical protein
VPAVFDDFVVGIGFIASLAVMLYMYATGKPVPAELYGLNGIFIGYYVRNVVAASKTTVINEPPIV